MVTGGAQRTGGGTMSPTITEGSRELQKREVAGAGSWTSRAAAAAVRASTRYGRGTDRYGIDVPLDADHWKDDDGSRPRSADDRAGARRPTPDRREIDDRAHVSFPSPDAWTPSWAPSAI
jgi:hypothetical protein